jgi:hypothetical protein
VDDLGTSHIACPIGGRPTTKVSLLPPGSGKPLRNMLTGRVSFGSGPEDDQPGQPPRTNLGRPCHRRSHRTTWQRLVHLHKPEVGCPVLDVAVGSGVAVVRFQEAKPGRETRKALSSGHLGLIRIRWERIPDEQGEKRLDLPTPASSPRSSAAGPIAARSADLAGAQSP